MNIPFLDSAHPSFPFDFDRGSSHCCRLGQIAEAEVVPEVVEEGSPSLHSIQKLAGVVNTSLVPG